MYQARCDDTVSSCLFDFAWGRHTPTISRVDWSAPSAGLLSITGKLRGYWASQFDVYVGGKVSRVTGPVTLF